MSDGRWPPSSAASDDAPAADGTEATAGTTDAFATPDPAPRPAPGTTQVAPPPPVPPGRGRGQRAARGPRPARGPRAAFVVVALVVIALLATAGGLACWALAPADAGDPRPVAFEVPAGATARRVAADLEAAGLLRDRRALLALLVWRGDQGRVGEGLYDLRRDLTVPQLADALVRGGRPRTARFVLPEGIRAGEVVARVAAAGWGEDAAAEMGRLVADPPVELRPAGHPAGAGLEGYLFPATYELPLRFDAADVVRALVARFEREASDVVMAELDRLGLDLHGWVTLASMVQAEAASDDETGIIAGVFLNRLDLGMPLQSDPTVAYGLGKELPQLDFPGGDFEVDHPWNTYTRAGLPLGPIGNPGAAALAAVLAPTRTDGAGHAWLYFLHGLDGSAPVFRPNLDFDGHLRDAARYLER